MEYARAGLGVDCRHDEIALADDYARAAADVPRSAVPGDAAAETDLHVRPWTGLPSRSIGRKSPLRPGDSSCSTLSEPTATNRPGACHGAELAPGHGVVFGDDVAALDAAGLPDADLRPCGAPFDLPRELKVDRLQDKLRADRVRLEIQNREQTNLRI